MLFNVALQPKGTGRLFVRFLDHTHTHTTHTHTHTHTHPVGLPCTSCQFVKNAATYTTHKKHKKLTFVLLPGFEPAIPVIEQTQNYALHRKPPDTHTRYEI
jgi:hypothetical protein